MMYNEGIRAGVKMHLLLSRSKSRKSPLDGF